MRGFAGWIVLAAVACLACGLQAEEQVGAVSPLRLRRCQALVATIPASASTPTWALGAQ